MGRISRGLELIGASWKLLKKDKSIMLFPLLSIVVSALIIVSFIAPFLFFGTFDFSIEMLQGYSIYLYMFALYIPLYFVGTFFNTAVVGCAAARINGENPNFKDGLRIASDNWFKILSWALLASTVGVILQLFREKLGFIGKMIISFIGIAWTYGVFFVVPVLIFEDKSVLNSVKKSASLFKDTWGETITGSLGFGIIFAILGFVGLIPLVLLTVMGLLNWILAIILGIIYFVMLFALQSALQGIFVTALYHYAKDGNLPGPFTTDIVPPAVDEGYQSGPWDSGS